MTDEQRPSGDGDVRHPSLKVEIPLDDAIAFVAHLEHAVTRGRTTVLLSGEEIEILNGIGRLNGLSLRDVVDCVDIAREEFGFTRLIHALIVQFGIDALEAGSINEGRP